MTVGSGDAPAPGEGAREKRALAGTPRSVEGKLEETKATAECLECR